MIPVRCKKRIILLLGTLLPLLSACSGGQETPTPGHDGQKVTLSLSVSSIPPGAKGNPAQGSPEESKIHALYVFVYNLGANAYCEAEKFESYRLEDKGNGQYSLEMKVTPDKKRFYLIANPRIVFDRDLSTYTQEDLQNVKMLSLADHTDGEGYAVNDELQAALAKNGLPMSMSITGRVELVKGDINTVKPKGKLTLDDGSTAFHLIRTVAKVEIICRVNKEVENNSLNLNTLELLHTNRNTYLMPKYKFAGSQWVFDWPALMEGAELSRRIGYQYGKQEGVSSAEWTVYNRGVHYLFENYFGEGVAGETVNGLVDNAKNSLIHIVLSDGRDRTFPLTYLQRNQHLQVTLNIWASAITCNVQPWKTEVIYPDYNE